MRGFYFIVLGEGKIKSAGPVKFDVDAALFAQFIGKGEIHVAALARQLKEIIRLVRFCLRREYPCRCGRRFCTEPRPLDQDDTLHASPGQRASNRQADHATPNDDRISGPH